MEGHFLDVHKLAPTFLQLFADRGKYPNDEQSKDKLRDAKERTETERNKGGRTKRRAREKERKQVGS